MALSDKDVSARPKGPPDAGLVSIWPRAAGSGGAAERRHPAGAEIRRPHS